MITRIQLQNWQCHAKLDVKFGQVTSLVGSSDAGKSAVLRALLWVATNQPGGIGFIRDGAKGCTVKVWVADHVVTRKRSRTATTNTYQIDDGPVLKAFGRGVPQDVADLFNMPPTCWQGQHDAPYWLALTAGQVGQQLNALVDLSTLDRTLAAAARGVKAARREEELAGHAKLEAQEAVQEAAVYDGLAGMVADMAELCTRAEETHDKAARLRLLVGRACAARQTHKDAQAACDAAKTVRVAVAAAYQADRSKRQLATLVKNAEMWRGQSAIELPTIDDTLDAKAKATRAKADRLADLIRTATKAKEEECSANTKSKQMRAMLPSTCPTCGQLM